MLLALAGVTGIGKSYYKDKIVERLNFKKIKIITTRKIREGEKNNEDKIFVTQKELEKLINNGEIVYKFEMLGNTYAYTKDDLFSNKNTVFEMHYNTIFDLKKVYPNLCSIYLMPKNLEKAKEKTRQRHLDPDIENKRILEIEEHYNRINTDNNLRNMFDYILYNDYNKESEEEVISLVSKLMLKDV